MKAVIITGGKQYLVEEGSVIYVEKLDIEPENEIVFEKENVLLVDGQAMPESAKVIAKVVKHGKQKKIIIFKYNPKKKYRKKQGHRQPYTKLEITKISK